MYERIMRVRQIAWEMYLAGEYFSYAECLNDAITGEATDYWDYVAIWAAVDHMTEW